MLIRDHVFQFEVKGTSFEGKPKAYLYAMGNISKMYHTFQIENRKLKIKVTYNFGAKLKDHRLKENAKCKTVAEQIISERASLEVLYQTNRFH